jgi:uncharacterized iron-regulated protein
MRKAPLYSFILLASMTIQSQHLDSLVTSSSISLKIASGKLVGDDIEKFKRLLRNTQFVSIAEEHEVSEVNFFSTALFDLLAENYGYNYLALEQGPILCDELNKRKIKNISSSVKTYAQKYKRAFHFSSDQELDFLESSTLKSNTQNPLWGCNQVYGAGHVLSLLHDLADPQYKSRIELLIDHAHKTENNRKDNPPYMCCVDKPEDLFKLNTFRYSKDSVYAKTLVDALFYSQSLYDLQNKSKRDNPTIYENNFKREDYMKKQFLKNYNKAMKQTNEIPKVMLKLGHWHLKNGLGPSGIPTLGSFVSSIAFTNQKTNLTIGVFINNEYDEFRGYKKGSLREYICSMIPNTHTYTLIHTTPLRKFYYSKKMRSQIPEMLKDEFRELIYSYDLLLYIKDASSVTWDLVYSAE